MSGMRVTVYASTKAEIIQVQNSKDLPGLAGFEQELKQTMRRQRGSRNAVLKLPTGESHGVSIFSESLVHSSHLSEFHCQDIQY